MYDFRGSFPSWQTIYIAVVVLVVHSFTLAAVVIPEVEYLSFKALKAS